MSSCVHVAPTWAKASLHVSVSNILDMHTLDMDCRDSPKKGRKGAAPFCKQRNNLICTCAHKEGAVARRGARKASYLVRMRELHVCDGV